jgi:hypothetical protein
MKTLTLIRIFFVFIYLAFVVLFLWTFRIDYYGCLMIGGAALFGIIPVYNLPKDIYNLFL